MTDKMPSKMDTYGNQVRRLEAEIDRLRAENERLRAALREVDQYLVIGGKAEKIVRCALGDREP